MTIESRLNEVLDVLLSDYRTPVASEQLIHCIDLTLLDEAATEKSLAQLNRDALINQVAAVCVYSKHLSQFQHLNPVQLATVINFPQGDEALITSLESIEKAAREGATEIDYVLSYHMYLNDKRHEALEQCIAIIERCKKKNLILKIILETGAFTEPQDIYELSFSLAQAGCNFLKTSTGKIAQGASLPAVFVMLSAIKDSGTICGVKISGGIKTPKQASDYAQLAELMMGKKIDKSWFRIGASSLLSELQKEVKLHCDQ